MANDFFVRFGSNAKAFGGELDADLAPARKAVAGLGTLLQGLEVTAASKKNEVGKYLAALSTEADEVRQKLESLGDSPDGQAAEVRAVGRAVMQDIQSAAAGLDGLIGKISAVATALGGITPAAKKAVAAENRAQGQRNSPANQERLRDPATGRNVASGSASAQPFYQAQQQALGQFIAGAQAIIARTATSAAGATPVTVSSIPQATIDEAAFERVVKAMQDNVSQGEKIEAAVDRVVAAVNRIPGKGDQVQTDVETGGEGAAATAIDGLAKLTKQQNAEISRAFRDILKTTRDSLGPDKAKELFQQLAGQQRQALSEGRSIIPEGALDEKPARTSRISSKREAQLTENLAEVDSAAATLRQELEKIAGDLEEGRQTGGGKTMLAAQAEYGRKLNELAGLEERAASVQRALIDEETRVLQAERQRRDTIRRAQAAAGQTISEDERSRRKTERGALELAASPDLAGKVGRGEGKLDKRGLQDIAEALTRQGYDPGLKPNKGDTGLTRDTVPAMLEKIAAQGQRYIEAGRATNEDLALRRVNPVTEVSTDVQSLLSGTRVKALGEQFAEPLKAAYKVLGEDLRTGGVRVRDTDARGIRSGDKTASGRREVGAATGEDGRAQLEEAIDIAKRFNLARANAARDDARSILRTDPNFDPHAIDRTVVGKDDEAQDNRRNLRSITAAIDELDDFSNHLQDLETNANNLAQMWSNVTNRLSRYESLERKPTEKENDQYAKDTAAQPRLEKERDEARELLRQAKSTYRDPDGGTADYLLTPEYRLARQRRDSSRFVQDPGGSTLLDRDGQRIRADETYGRNRGNSLAGAFEREQALRGAVNDFFGRSKIFATNDGNTRDYVSRTLPGVRSAGKPGRERLEFINDEDNARPESRRALAKMTAGQLGYATYLNRLVVQMSDSDTEESALNETREKLKRALTKLLGGYQTAFPSSSLNLDPRLLLPPQLGFKDDTFDQALDGDQFAKGTLGRRDRADAAQAKIDKIDADAEAAANDPNRSEKARNNNLKAVRAQIKELNQRLKEITAESQQLQQDQAGATRRLNKALGPKLKAEAAELQKTISDLERQQLKSPLSDEDRTRKDRAQARLSTIYEGTSPAIREAKAERDDILRRRFGSAPGDTPQQGDPALRTDVESRRKTAQDERELARARRKALAGRVDPGDLEKVDATVTQATKRAARAEADLVVKTEELARARQEAKARELATRSRLSPSLAGEFDAQTSERDELRQKIAAIRNGPDFRADAEDFTTDSAEKTARRDKAASDLLPLERRLGELATSLQSFERLGGALDPQTRAGTRRGALDPAIRGGRVEEQVDTTVLEKRIADLTLQEERLRRTILESTTEAETAQRELTEMLATFRQANARRGDKAVAEPELRNAAGGGSAGSGGGGETALGGADDAGGRGNNVLRQILEAVNRVNTTLKSGVKVSGRASGVEGEGEAKPRKTTTAKKAAAERVGYTGRSTKEGRADFEEAVSTQIPAIEGVLKAATDSSKAVKAGVELVTRGILNETDAINYFRDRLELTRVEAVEFGAQVRKGVGNARLTSAVGAASDQRAKEEARAGERAAKDAQRKAAEDEKAAARTGKANERAARALREEALAASELQRTMDRLSPATRAEVAELERLAKSSTDSAASQAKLAAQMAKVYGLVAQDLHASSPTGSEPVTNINRSASAVIKGAGVDISGAELQGVRREARGLGLQVDREAADGAPAGGIFGEQSAFTRRMFGQAGFWSRVMSSTGAFVVRNFTAGFVFGLTNALQEVIGEAIQTEATFVRVSHALEATGRSSAGLRGQLQSVATDLGTNLNDVYKTAAGLTGLFKTTDEIAGATRIVSQLQLISDGALNAQEAMGTLASIQGAFGDQLGGGVDGLEHVADVLTTIQNTIGTNVEIVAEGIGRMSGLAQQLGLSLEEVGVYTAQIAKLTNQTGAAAGEQFSRILSVIQTGRGRTAISKNFGTVQDRDENGDIVKGSAPRQTGVEDLLATRDYSGVLRVMSAEWKNLSKAQQQNVSVSIAGQRQAAAFAALLNNGAQSADAITRAENSHGAAEERVTKIMQTLNGQIAKLGSNFQGVASNLIRSGLLNFIIVLLKATNGLLSAFNAVFTKINDFADKSPILSFLADFAFGMVGLAIAITVVKKAFDGFRESIRSAPAVQNFQRGVQQGAVAPGGVAGPTVRERAGASVDRTAERVGNFFRRDDLSVSRSLSERIGNRSAAFGTSASFNAFTARSLRDAAGREADPAVARSMLRQANALGVQARASDLAARATGRLSNGLAKISAGGLAAEGALAGVTIALGLIAANAQAESESSAVLNKLREEDAKKNKKKPQDDVDAYVGPATQGYKDVTKNYTDEGSQSTGGAVVIGKFLSNLITLKSANLTTAIDQSLGTSGLGKETYGLSQVQAGVNASTDRLKNASATGGNKAVFAEQKKIYGDMAKAVEAIDNNGDLSKNQKIAFRANIEQAKLILADQVEVLVAASKGLAEAAILENEQIKRIGETSQLLVGLQGGGDTLRELRAGFEGVLGEAGLDKNNPELKEAMERLTRGGLSTAQAAQERVKILKSLADQAESKYLAALKTGETEIIDETRGQFLSLAQQVSEATLANVQTYVQSATALSNEAAQLGDFKGERAALTTALRNIQAERPKGVISKQGKRIFSAADDELNAQIDQVAKPVQDRINLSRITEANAPSRLNAAQAPGNLNQANQALSQAQTTLNVLTQSRTDNARIGASEQEITDAQIALITAQQNAAKALQDNNAAAIAEQIAGTWNAAKIDLLNVSKANADLAYAVATFGEGSTEALSAAAALAGAKKTSAENRIGRRAGQRQADIAAIPQGNAVGVANAQLASAQAAVQDAKRYGQNSTQYTGALAQLYSAQQQATAATGAIAVAQAQLAQAYATASGNAVGAAHAGVAVAQATLAAAQQASGGAVTAETLGAQASLVAANQAVQDAQVALVQSRIQVTIALADASGNTVKSARLQIQAALAQLKSETPGTAEFNQARAAVISARAGARDAELQDKLDTVDFNLQMGKITQASAITALKQILATSDLTKAQRRQLLLQIKGMKQELADSSFNIGENISLPTAYEYRRYAQEQGALVRQAAETRYGGTSRGGALAGAEYRSSASSSQTNNFYIDGAETEKVKKIVTDVVGGKTSYSNTRTSAARRGR